MAVSLELVRVPDWDAFPWLRHGFSTRMGGNSSVYGGANLNLGYTAADERETVERNRRLAMQALDSEGTLATVKQVHGLRVVAVAGSGSAQVEADGMITDSVGIALGIQVADCVPLLLADTRRRVVGALHAGWRGTVAGMAAMGVRRMAEEFGSQKEDVIAAVGPSIGPCCYAVGEELIEQVGWSSGLLERRKDIVYFDLWEANRRQLAAAGAQRITVLKMCTACARTADGQRLFFSHRAEAGFTGRAMGLIALV
jgi:YfiH family protein